MTNSIAIGLGLIILIGLGIDYAVFGFENLIFLTRKFILVLDYLAFWR